MPLPTPSFGVATKEPLPCFPVRQDNLGALAVTPKPAAGAPLFVAALYVETGVAERLARRLKSDCATGCLLWMGARNAKGYGTINVGGRPRFVHRVAWEISKGSIPNGLCVLHRCDTPACCNTEHHFLGSKADNNADMRAKGRARNGVRNSEKTHCKRGHLLAGDNLRVTRGRRHCRACLALWAREKRAASA